MWISTTKTAQLIQSDISMPCSINGKIDINKNRYYLDLVFDVLSCLARVFQPHHFGFHLFDAPKAYLYADAVFQLTNNGRALAFNQSLYQLCASIIFVAWKCRYCP